MSIETASEPTLDPGQVLAFLREQARRPMSLEGLARELRLDESGHESLHGVLQALVADGRLVQTGDRYGCPEKLNLVVGKLSTHADGYGFIVNENEGDDLFVPGRHLGDAMHNDRVVGRVEHKRRSGKLEGRVIRVLERARRTLVGKLEKSRGSWWVVPLDPRLGASLAIPVDALGGAEAGKIVYAEITEYPAGGRGAEGRILEVLGDAGDPQVDADVVIREFELPHAFPDAVLQEAASVPTTVTAEEIEGRTDFRDRPIITIDGESAQDFDDAVYVEILPTGIYRLHVHIADVSHYVRVGSAIDDEARRRATSVYFPDRVIPMLPESLSNEICSLKPGVDRLVQSVLIDIDRQGRTVDYEFHDGVIRSSARMTYREVAAVLGGDEQMAEKHAERQLDLERLRELAEILMESRRSRGSIDFDLPEPELVINLRGETEDIVRAERNVAHRIIEEFMIRANEVVASHLTWEGMASLYRVHEGPDPERVERFREFISGLGHRLGGGEEPRPRDFMDLLARLEGRPEERVISTLLLRTMKRASYKVANEGHFGLASERYTHFTSPIRRYPDLIVHRVLRAERGSEHQPAFDLEQLLGALDRIASDSSEQERRAEEAEREYCAWKKVQFMADKLGEVYEGHITGVKSFGLFVELEPIFVEGLISVSSLGDDYYAYDEPKHRLRGENNGRVFALGDRVKIRVAKVDLERRRLDFSLEEGPLELPVPPPAADRPRRRSRRGGRGRGRARSTERPTQAPPKERASRALPEHSATAPGGGEALQLRSEPTETASPSPDRESRPRRRGRRGGRRRTGGRDGEVAAAPAPEPERVEKPPTRPTDSAPEPTEKPAAKPAARRSARGSLKENDEAAPKRDVKKRAPRGGSASEKRGTGRPARGRGRSSQSQEVKPAAARAETPPAPEREGDVDRPKVNPYLTEVDY